MNWSRKVRMIGAHAEGEIGRVIVEGAPDIPGETMLERLTWLNQNGDDLRRFTLFEPRGAAQMTINLLTSPCSEGAHVGFIPMQGDGSHAMSGSNAMCVTTVLLESGMLPMQAGSQRIVLDTAAGPVTAMAKCCGNKVESVSLDFFPSFAEQLGAEIEMDVFGKVRADVAFGGVYYILVDAAQLGLNIEPGPARQLVSIGNRLLRAAREQITVQHPVISEFNAIEFCMFTGVEDSARRVYRNATIMPPGRLDRSPCGTGSAARLAVMHARGDVGVGEEVTMRSAIGSRFLTRITGVTQVGDHQAVLPTITGRAWIFSDGEYGVNASDPFPDGFTLGDTWGDGIEHEIPSL